MIRGRAVADVAITNGAVADAASSDNELEIVQVPMPIIAWLT